MPLFDGQPGIGLVLRSRRTLWIDLLQEHPWDCGIIPRLLVWVLVWEFLLL